VSVVPDRRRVLIFPAGSEIGLEIRQSLKYSHHVEVFGASGKNDHASFCYDEDHYAEDALYVDQPDFIERFNALLRRWRIEFVYPTHDTISCFLAEHQEELQAVVITSCAATNRIARSKSLTYQTFAPFDFCPTVYPRAADDLPFPVFLKPDNGQGGKGTYIAHCREDLDFYLRRDPALLITEFLPGDELSVDCFTDFDSRLRFVGPRTRERVTMGISFRSTAVEVTPEIRRIAETINSTVALDGAWFFQTKQDRHGVHKLMEIAPRQSSTMGLYRHAGVNFALLSFFNAQRKPVDIHRNDYSIQLDRSLRNRYRSDLSYRHVYIDLDETMIMGGQVHEYVMAFVYQCRNRGVALTLITKHRGDLGDTLATLGISERLFDEIVHLRDDQSKCDFIRPQDAIFIDNYWVDRQQVHRRFGIPVFDTDAIECLLR
jgi:hypothetical protein